MKSRQRSWPRIWLMTDERMGHRLSEAVGRLPEGAGVVVRHYSLSPAARLALAQSIAEVGRERGLVLAVARDEAIAKRVGAALLHNAVSTTQLPFSRSVHTMAEAQAARADGAALVFVSPVLATRSHPGQAPLGPELAVRIARAAEVPAIALGGVDEQRFSSLGDAFYGWAAIDAWLATRT